VLLPCETGVKTVLPAVKALVAKNIVEKHGMKEQQVASILGLSQSAVSRYLNNGRGNLISLENLPAVQEIIDKMTHFLINEPQKKNEILKLFCTACQIIRGDGLLCPLCKEKMNEKWADSCTFCNPK
jgi:predicted transcriptional regulator